MIVLLFTKTLDSYCLTSSSFIKSRRYLTIFSQTSRSFAFWGEPESPRYFLPLQIKCFSIYCKVTWLVCLTILFQKPLLTMEARNNELYLKAWVALAAGIVPTAKWTLDNSFLFFASSLNNFWNVFKPKPLIWWLFWTLKQFRPVDQSSYVQICVLYDLMFVNFHIVPADCWFCSTFLVTAASFFSVCIVK